ncbi:PAS domain-containing protein [Planococcus salinus]|uniref:PAS domain-containing protein n=1 Tax=Planococcus salinus TaxID=1848460 RepID=A0A3M8P9F8_9BACL|nr:PAS domain-containing protein [Planococcus salinus]RNF40283.1 PAS domain-containing protein [Planococcus salinus]
MYPMKSLDDKTQTQLLEAMLDGSRVGTIVTDPKQKDNPIIYTNKTFLEMTGYAEDEVIGRNCRFLQGEETDHRDVEKIRDAVKARESVTVTIQNYRKDGTPFWNRLAVRPVQVEDSLYFIGTQTDITLERSQQQAIMANEMEIERLMLPILAIQENVATVALVGTMNLQRFEMLKVKICEYVQEHRIEHAIIDITGLSWDDNPPLHWFLQIRDALRIMGSNLYVTGISPYAAQEFVTDESLDGRLTTFSTIEKALAFVTKETQPVNHTG